MDNLSARKAEYEKFDALGIQILGISADNPFSQKALADSLKLPYPLLSDQGLKATRAYGVVYGKTSGKTDYPEAVGLIAKRSFFLIDRQGIVRGRWIGEDLAVFPNEVLLKAARGLAAQK
jgi:glutaredoxin-dependent peroxiredoxin